MAALISHAKGKDDGKSFFDCAGDGTLHNVELVIMNLRRGSTSSTGQHMWEKVGTAYTVKKVSGFPGPSRDVTYQTLPGRKLLNYSRPERGCHLPNSTWPGIVKLFPARESLVSDILAGERKTANLFYSVFYTVSRILASKLSDKSLDLNSVNTDSTIIQVNGRVDLVLLAFRNCF